MMRRFAVFWVWVFWNCCFCPLQAAESMAGLEDLFVLSDEAQQVLASSAAAAPESKLPFAVSADFAGGSAIFSFKIAPGAYIYKDSLKAVTAGSSIECTLAPLPAASAHQDAFGVREVYFEDFRVEVLILNSSEGEMLKLEYQGCDAAGICYPPSSESLKLPEHHSRITRLEDAPIEDAEPSLLSAEGMAQHFWLAAGLCLLLGAGLDLTPCVLPLLAVYSAMIVGSAKKTFGEALALNTAYLAGLVLVYAALGLIIASAGMAAHVWLHHPLVIILTAALFILLALNCAGAFAFNGLNRLNAAVQRRLSSQQRGKLGSAFSFGALSALLSTPCTSAPLAGALLYVLQGGNVAAGTVMFMAIGLGMGLPLFFIGIFGTRFLPKSGPAGELIKRLMAVPLIYAAFAVSAALLGERTWLVQLVVLSLCFAYMVWCLSAYLNFGTHRLRLLLGAVVFAGCCLGCLQLTSAPLHHNFAALGTYADLQEYRGKPVVVTFSAEWCVNCHAMDASLYSSPEYQELTAGLAGVRFDLTDADSEANRELCEKFAVAGVPYLAVLDESGEIRAALAGYADFAEVKALLESTGVLNP